MSSHEVFKNEMMFDTEGKREQGIRIMYYPTEFYTARPAKLKLCREDSSLILVASNYPFMIRDAEKWLQGPLTMFVNGDGSPTTIASSIRYWRFMDEEEAEQSYTELEKRFLNDEQRHTLKQRFYHEIRRRFYE